VPVLVSHALHEQSQSASEVQLIPVQLPWICVKQMPQVVSQTSVPGQSRLLVHPPEITQVWERVSQVLPGLHSESLQQLPLGSPGTQALLASQTWPEGQFLSLEHARPPATHRLTGLSHV
jgi:hypothetical protein